jgi:ActR/RegA family two-component response regulator
MSPTFGKFHVCDKVKPLESCVKSETYIDMSDRNTYKVLIGEDEATTARRLADFLKERGFETRVETSGVDLQKVAIDWQPHFCLVNMMLKDYLGLNFLKFAVDHKINTKTFITSSHNNVENVKQALKAGANDYIVKPYKPEDILSRLVFHIQRQRHVPAQEKKGPEDNTLVHLINFGLREAVQPKRIKDILFNHAKMLEIALKAVRVSIIKCEEDRLTGHVMISSDDRGLFGLKIDMNRYPEVIHVMNTEKMVVIENMDGDPTMAAVKEQLKSISFNSIIVAPLWRHGRFYGVLSARLPKDRTAFSDRDIRFTQMLSYIVSTMIGSDIENSLELKKAA